MNTALAFICKINIKKERTIYKHVIVYCLNVCVCVCVCVERERGWRACGKKQRQGGASTRER